MSAQAADPSPQAAGRAERRRRPAAVRRRHAQDAGLELGRAPARRRPPPLRRRQPPQKRLRRGLPARGGGVCRCCRCPPGERLWAQRCRELPHYIQVAASRRCRKRGERGAASRRGGGKAKEIQAAGAEKVSDCGESAGGGGGMEAGVAAGCSGSEERLAGSAQQQLGHLAGRAVGRERGRDRVRARQ